MLEHLTVGNCSKYFIRSFHALAAIRTSHLGCNRLINSVLWCGNDNMYPWVLAVSCTKNCCVISVHQGALGPSAECPSASLGSSGKRTHCCLCLIMCRTRLKWILWRARLSKSSFLQSFVSIRIFHLIPQMLYFWPHSCLSVLWFFYCSSFHQTRKRKGGFRRTG